MRRGILERFRAAYGDRPFALLPAEWIEALLDAKPPHAARSWLVTLRSLCQFAVKRGLLRADPTANIKQRSIKGDGFHTWTDDEIAQFEAHHPIGTKPRLAFALLLYTTQRRGDVVRMGRQHIRETQDGPALYVKQHKTGVELLIPIHPELQRGARRHAERTSDVPGHRDRQALRRQRISARAFGTGATPPDCRSDAARTGCARRPAAGSPRPDAAQTRSWRTADTGR